MEGCYNFARQDWQKRCRLEKKKNGGCYAQNFAEATRQLQQVVAKGDVVLYENDLPDTFK